MLQNDKICSDEFNIDICSFPEWRNDLLSIIIKNNEIIKISKSDNLVEEIGLKENELYELGKNIVEIINKFKKEGSVVLSNHEEVTRLWVKAENNGQISLNGYCESQALSEAQSSEILQMSVNFITSRKLLA